MITEQDLELYLSFCEKIAHLRDEFDFSVTSWWRSPKRNKAVGGVPNSRHVDGLGLDIVLDDVSQEPEVFGRIKELGLKFKNYKDKNHIHLEV